MNIFKLVGSIFIDTDKANESMDKTKEKSGSLAQGFGGAIKKAGEFALGVTAAASAVGAGMVAMATKSAESLDEIQKGAQKMELSYEEYQKLSYACDRSGMSIDSLGKGVKKITQGIVGMQEGNSKATKSFDELGVSLQNADGSARSTEDVLNDTLMVLADMEDTAKRGAMANEIFGGSYKDMLPLLNSGSEGIKDMMQNCEDLGLVMSDEMVDAGAGFGDMLADVKDSFGAVVTKIGAEVFPIIEELLQWVLAHMPEIQDFIGKVFAFIQQMIPVVIGVIKKIEPVVSALFSMVKKLWATVLKPVLDVIISVIDGTFKQRFIAAFESIKQRVSSIFSALVGVVKAPINSIISVLNGFIGGLNKLKAPDWVPLIGGKGVNIPTIPMLAKGGDITGQGSAIVGEAGAELINLPKGASVTPLGASNNVLGDLLEVTNKLPESIASKLMDELANGIDMKWNGRNLGRLYNEAKKEAAANA